MTIAALGGYSNCWDESVDERKEDWKIGHPFAVRLWSGMPNLSNAWKFPS